MRSSGVPDCPSMHAGRDGYAGRRECNRPISRSRRIGRPLKVADESGDQRFGLAEGKQVTAG